MDKLPAEVLTKVIDCETPSATGVPRLIDTGQQRS